MRSTLKFLVTLATLALCVPLVGSTPHASAAGGFTLVEGPDRFLLDASDDGRFVLTTGLAVERNVVDMLTGQSTTLPADVAANRISGDGKLVAFVTTMQLSGADTDGTRDVYTYNLATGQYRFMSPGFSTFEFNGVEIDNTGNVAFDGASASFGSVATFLSDGSTPAQLGATLGTQSSGQVSGISSDGRYVSYRAGNDLYVEDRNTSNIVQANVGAAAGQTVLASKLSGNGRHIVMVVGSPMATYLRHLDAAQTETLGTFNTLSTADTGLGISADGSVVSLLRNTPTDPPVGFSGPPVQLPGLFTWTNGTATVISNPTGVNANGHVERAFVLPDGTKSLFNSHASNLGPTVTSSNNVYIDVPNAKPNPSPTPPWGDASAYTPRTPVRILDTRSHGPAVGYSGAIPAPGDTIPLAIRGYNGVPSNASAVAVQVTAAEGTTVGFVGATPSGAAVGQTSNLNLDQAGETIANLAVVPVGPDGVINLFTSSRTHLIVDLVGWWTPAPGAVAAGRYNVVAPDRLLDTRPESLIGYTGAKPVAGATTVVQVTGRGGVPSSGVSAVALNLTLDQAAAAGFVQVAPAESLVPGATSTLNVSSANQIVAAATIVPVDSMGRIAIFNQPSTHVIVDVSGWFTDGTAAASTSGRFVPATTVTRTLDTRPTARLGWGGPKPTPTMTINMAATGAALVGNVTITETAGPGFVQLGPAATLSPGATSNINATSASETIANAFISPVAAGLGIYTIVGTHVLVDISGYMTS